MQSRACSFFSTLFKRLLLTATDTMHYKSLIFISLLAFISAVYGGWRVRAVCDQMNKLPKLIMENGNCVKYPGDRSYTYINTAVDKDGQKTIRQYSCQKDCAMTGCKQKKEHLLSDVRRVNCSNDTPKLTFFFDNAEEPDLAKYADLNRNPHYHRVLSTYPGTKNQLIITYYPPHHAELGIFTSPCTSETCIGKYELNLIYDYGDYCPPRTNDISKNFTINKGPYEDECSTLHEDVTCDIYEMCTGYY